MMSTRIIEGPPDNSSLPQKSLGILIYEEIQKWGATRVAMVDITNEEITYKTVWEVTIKLAKKLKSLGVKTNDVITIISHNQWNYVATIIAGFYLGATVNCLNPGYTVDELKRLLTICKPVVIFCTSATLKNILPLKEESFFPSNIVCYDNTEETPDIKNFEKLLIDLDDGDFTPVEVNPKEDVALILTSSGTTGLPKCVQLTHSNIRLTMVYAHDPEFFDMKDKDNLIGFLPLFHIFGNAIALASILIGFKLVILDKFVPEHFLATIEKHKITKLLVVPSILLFLVKSPLVEKFDLSSIDDVLVGADAVGKEVEEMAKEKLKNAEIRQLYGMTELCGAVTVIPRHEKKYGSCGKVIPTLKIKVCDVKIGDNLPAKMVGELRFKGDGVMKGYLGNIAETQQAFDDEGYLKSGDLGCFDREGYFYYKERLKEIIKYKGFQVSPAELENLLLQHPAVKDAGVVGKSDERAGEVPVAFVVKQPGKDVTEEELVTYVADRISDQKHLYGGVRFIEEIPKNPGGKTLRRKLKDLL